MFGGERCCICVPVYVYVNGVNFKTLELDVVSAYSILLPPSSASLLIPLINLFLSFRALAFSLL